MLNVVKIWFAAMSDLRQNYQLLVVTRDYADENTSHEIKDFFTEESSP
jgi:hypothetical protein